ncbi:MAG: hypothetical protein WCF78_00600 [archaeon]
MVDIKKKVLIVCSLTLLFLVIISGVAFAGVIDQINVTFDKQIYSTTDDAPIRVGFTLENNNQEIANLRVYTDCDNDELSCDYSRSFTLNQTTSETSSFIVTPTDTGHSTLILYVLDTVTGNTKSFNVDIYSDDGIDDGKFEVDLGNSGVCINQENQIYFTINNNFTSGLYEITLVGDKLSASPTFDNPIYLSSSDKEIHFNLEIDGSIPVASSINATLRIVSDRIVVNKQVTFYAKDCNTETIDFQVTGPNTTNFLLKKENLLSIDYTIKNISTKTKDFFVTYDNNSDITYTLSTRQVRLSPGQSRKITLTAYADRDTASGSYPLNLQFFDEKSVITKNLHFLVDPIFNLDVRTTQNALALNIGQTSNLLIIIENKGDIEETFRFNYTLSNDLRINNQTQNEEIVVFPHSTRPLNLSVTAGPNTKEMTSQIVIEATGDTSGYTKSLVIDVIASRGNESLRLNFLSYPDQIDIDSNSQKNFSFQVYNFSDEDIKLSSIQLVGVPQEIRATLPTNVLIPKKQSITISGTIITGEIVPQEINAALVLYSEKGGVLSTPLKIRIVGDQNISTEPEEPTTGLTGFFTLKNSIFLGIVGACLLVVILFALGAFKRRDYYHTEQRRR